MFVSKNPPAVLVVISSLTTASAINDETKLVNPVAVLAASDLKKLLPSTSSNLSAFNPELGPSFPSCQILPLALLAAVVKSK